MRQNQREKGDYNGFLYIQEAGGANMISKDMTDIKRTKPNFQR